MIISMEGLSYKNLKLWSLEERRNRQDLIEVFKMAKGMTRIRPQELFMLEENTKGTRGLECLIWLFCLEVCDVVQYKRR